MKVVRYDQLLDGIRPHLSGCGDGLIVRTMRSIGQEFCRRSQCWREKISKNMVAGTRSYTLTSAFSADIQRVRDVWFLSATDVTNGEDGTLQDINSIKFTPPSTLLLPYNPGQSITGGLVVRVILTPQYNADEIGDEVANLWGFALEAGVIGRIKAMPNQPWSDERGARDWSTRFDDGITQAETDSDKNFTNMDLTSTGPGWLI